LRFIVYVFLPFVLSPAPALADWEYTHWGMTSEQVAAASSGNVKVLPKSERQAAGDHSEIAAMGNFMFGGRSLSVGFEFDTVTGGLNCVMYNAMGDDVAMIKDTLLKKYGQTKETSFGGAYSMTWRTPDLIEFAVGERPLAAAVSHCRAGF
jgi:hypothetical protein